MNLEDFRIALDLPEGSSERLIKLKLAQVEFESKRRQDDNRLEQLEEILKQETESLILLKKKVDQDLSDKKLRKKKMHNHVREAEYYRSKIDKLDINKLDQMEDEIKLAQKSVREERNKLKRLNKCLEEYGDLEPTNEALKERINELKASRLSLDMSFV